MLRNTVRCCGVTVQYLLRPTDICEHLNHQLSLHLDTVPYKTTSAPVRYRLDFRGCNLLVISVKEYFYCPLLTIITPRRVLNSHSPQHGTAAPSLSFCLLLIRGIQQRTYRHGTDGHCSQVSEDRDHQECSKMGGSLSWRITRWLDDGKFLAA